MKGAKRVFSLLVSAALTASLLPMSIASAARETVLSVDFENASVGWGKTLAEAKAEGDGNTYKTPVENYEEISVEYEAFPSNTSESGNNVTEARIMADGDNQYIQLKAGTRAADTTQLPKIVIDNAPQSTAGNTSVEVTMSFDAMLMPRNVGNVQLAIGVGDSLVLSRGSFGIVDNKWQKYKIVLNADSKTATITVDDETTEIVCDMTKMDSIYNAIASRTNSCGSICIDNIVVATETVDNSPNGKLERFLNDLLPSGVIKDDVSFPADRNGYELSWSVSDTSLIDLDGKIYPRENDAKATITVSGIAYNDTTVKATVTSEVTVAGIGDLSAEQKVIYDEMTRIAGGGEEYAPVMLDDDLELPVYNKGFIATEWSSNSNLLKIYDGYANIVPPIYEETSVNLTARVYCTRNPQVYYEETYEVKIVPGSGHYRYVITDTYADIDFESDAGKSAALIQTGDAPNVEVGNGQARIIGNVRGSGAGSLTTAAVENDNGSLCLNITNGQFAGSNRNSRFVFTNAPEFSSLNGKVMMLSFDSKLTQGSVNPTIQVSAETGAAASAEASVLLKAEDLGVAYGQEFSLSLFADYDNARLVVVVYDADKSVTKIFDRALPCSSFASIRNLSEGYSGTVKLDNVVLAAVEDAISKVEIATGVENATVEIKDYNISVLTDKDGIATLYLPNGEYDVSVTRSAYHSKNEKIAAMGGSVSYDMKLEQIDPATIIDEFSANLKLADKNQKEIEMEADVYEIDGDVAALIVPGSEVFTVTFGLKDASIVKEENAEEEDKNTEVLPEDLSQILASDGSVAPMFKSDVKATLVATVSAAGVTPRTKEFPVLIKNISETMEAAAAGLETTGILCNGSNAASTPAAGSLILPKLGSYDNMSVLWKSNSSYFDDNGALIAAPAEETSASFTATVVYERGNVRYTVDKTLPVLVASRAVYDASTKAAVEAVLPESSFTSADVRGQIVDLTKFVCEDFYLPKTYAGNAQIKYTWTSNSDAVVVKESNNEYDIAEFYPKKDSSRDSKESIRVTLKVTAAYISNGQTIATESKDIVFTSRFDEKKGAKYIIRGDMGCDENFTVRYNNSSRLISDMKYVSSNITDLKTEGYFGSNISWNSSSTALGVSGSRLVPKPASSDVNVTLTVAVSAKDSQEAPQSKTVQLIVEGTGGGSSSGSSSGSGVSTIKGSPTGSNNAVTSPSSQFTDLTNAEWARTPIEALAAKGVVSGKQNGVFAPNDNVTRAEFAQMLIKAMSLSDANAVCDALSDVNSGDWYYTSVATAYNKGIILGYDDGRFGVNDLITRQDMASIVYRAAKAGGINLAEVNEIGFADEADIAEYANEAVTALAKAGIINGMDGNFVPRGNATRAQAAVIIYNITK